MPSATKLSLDLVFGIMAVVSSPGHSGTVYDVMITDQGLVDGGTIETAGNTVTFYDGMGERKSKVMSLVAVAPQSSRYLYEHKTEPAREVDLDEVVLNRKEFKPSTAEGFEFRIVDGSVVQYYRVKDVIYLHLDGTPNTIVLQR